MERLYTMLELIEHYKNDTLPKDVTVFKYQSAKGEGYIHKDELHREVVVSGIYSTMHQDRIIGTKTTPEPSSMKGVDTSNWKTNRR